MSDENNPAVFPRPFSQILNAGGEPQGSDFGSEGMTLRDYFAGQALTGIFANEVGLQEIISAGERSGLDFLQAASKAAYAVADAMLEARKQ